MKNFLKKYVDEDQLKAIEAKYLEDNPESKELPIHIGKSRLDEVLGQKKGAEKAQQAAEAALKAAQEAHEVATKEALTAAEKQWNDAKKVEIDTLTRDFQTTEAIYKAHGRNVKAIKALIDPKKKIEDEIVRLQKDEAYLFGDGKGDLPPGTGRSGGSGNDAGTDEELQAMRMAVGL